MVLALLSWGGCWVGLEFNHLCESRAQLPRGLLVHTHPLPHPVQSRWFYLWFLILFISPPQSCSSAYRELWLPAACTARAAVSWATMDGGVHPPHWLTPPGGD